MQEMSIYYYRISSGKKSVYHKEFLEGSFIAVDFNLKQDLTHHHYEDWREFNHLFIPIYLTINPHKSKIAAGLACGMLHTVATVLVQGDIVLIANGSEQYSVGEIISDYYYVPSSHLCHRRKVRWLERSIAKERMSSELQSSIGSAAPVCNLNKYANEIQGLIESKVVSAEISTLEVNNTAVFALEKHLEDFLVSNWPSTDLGKAYDLLTDEADVIGQQYQTDTGAIDILAVSKDKKTLLVIELKRGRASDVVLGQIQRYMGYVKDELANSGQQVKGLILALEDDLKLRRALSVAHNIEFYRYQVNFKMVKAM